MEQYDLAIVGAGAAGLIAADFALRLGVRVVMLEKDRIGGDCTGTGCVPSKSLLRVASVAHTVKQAERLGLRMASEPVDLAEVREYLRKTIAQIYAPTAPNALRARGLDVCVGPTRFVDAHTLECGEQRLQAKKILIGTGATPKRPAIAGIEQVEYETYLTIFENDQLPKHLLVMGGGPVGCEVAQAYRRLGAQVTVFAPRLLPAEDEDVSEMLRGVFEGEGMEVIPAAAEEVRGEGDAMEVRAGQRWVQGDRLLVAAGRAPAGGGLGLEAAGGEYSDAGIVVNEQLQTSVPHIYAAGDVVGGPQYSHLAGWQGFQAVRNAMMPGKSQGKAEVLPRVTFTSPEVAHVGMTEAQARAEHGRGLVTRSMPLSKIDRAVNEDDRVGMLKLHATRKGEIVGATMVAERAGEAITEIVLAMRNRIGLKDLASTVHPYPTYNSGIQMLATQMVLDTAFSGVRGKVLRALARRSSRR